MNLISLSIKRPTFILMITLFFIVIGGLALKQLPVDLYPDVSYPVLSVRANLPGAAPEEIEELVTKPLEDNLSSLAGLVTIRSSSREGSSNVTLEFSAGEDIKFQEMQVRAKVANMRRSLPDDLSEPVVQRQDPDDTPIIELAITGNRTASELTRIVDEEIAERIRQVPGVGEVELGGERMREVVIDLKTEAIEAWRISIADVIQAVRDFSGNNPIGNLNGEKRTWLLRSTSHVKGVNDLKSVPVASKTNGEPLLLETLATISDGFADVRRVSRLSDGKTLKPAIDLDIKKQSGENTVNVSDDVLKLLEALRDDLPSDITITVTRDNAELVRTNVADVFETLIIGAFLTIAVVLLFLRSPRATITTGVSLPSSIITTFAIMAVAGFTINIMTLLALSLAIGLLVDDAIVVRENIFRHLQLTPNDPKQAALKGTQEVSLAVIATTLTIVAVFLPVGFMGGVIGQFFKQFAVTVVFAIMVSLWDALTMAPMLSAYFANIANPAKEWEFMGRTGARINHALERFEHSFAKWEEAYAHVLAWILPRPKAALGIGFGSLGLAVLGFIFVTKSFLPTQLGQVFSANLNGPLATPIEQVIKLSEQVNEKVKTVEGLEYWTLRAGQTGSGNANVGMTLRIKDKFATNQASLAKVRDDLRKALTGIVGYNIRISEPSDPLAGSTGRFQPAAVLISGSDLVVLRDIARQIQALMGEIDGITDIAPLQDEGIPELELKTSPKLAAHFGVTPKALSNELRAWIEGDTSNNLQLGQERIPIRIRLGGAEEMSVNTLMAKSIFAQTSKNGETVAIPIGSTVILEAGASPSVISRENRQKILRVGASIERGAALGTVVSRLEARLKELPLPNGYHARIVGQSEQMNELFSNLVVSLLLGCLFMYMILASLFESFLQPFTVMAAVPLAATGAVLSLMLFGLPLDLYGGIGMILLAGIVAKNSILLVDFAMQRVKDEGIEPAKAILTTAPLRLRPILMTSIAMIVGMLPVATGLGVGGAARQSLGIATIGGIISSTLLTLVVVPNLYVAVEAFAKTWRSKQA